MADTPALGAGAARRGGSSPPFRRSNIVNYSVFLIFLVIVSSLVGCTPSIFNSSLKSKIQSFQREFLTSEFSGSLPSEPHYGDYLFSLKYEHGDLLPTLYRQRISDGVRTSWTLDSIIPFALDSRIERFAIRPDGEAFALLVRDNSAAFPHLLIVTSYNSSKGEVTPLKLAGDAYDIAWCGNSLFYSIRTNERADSLYRVVGHQSVLVYQELDTRRSLLLKQSRTTGPLIALSKGLELSDIHLFLEDGTPAPPHLSPSTSSHIVAAEYNRGLLLLHREGDSETLLSFSSLGTSTIFARTAAHEVFESFYSTNSGIVILGRKGYLTRAWYVSYSRKGRWVLELPKTVASLSVESGGDRGGVTITLPRRALPALHFFLDETSSPPNLKPSANNTFESDALTYSLLAPGDDGVPISLTYNSQKPLRGFILESYGAYGAGVSSTFSPLYYLLLNRGIGLAQVHLRGGNEGGRDWHLSGENVAVRSSGILNAVKTLKSRFPKVPIVLISRSAGACMTLDALSREPILFSGAILEAPYFPSAIEADGRDMRFHEEWGEDPICRSNESEKLPPTLVLLNSQDREVRATSIFKELAPYLNLSPPPLTIVYEDHSDHFGPSSRGDMTYFESVKGAYIENVISSEGIQ